MSTVPLVFEVQVDARAAGIEVESPRVEVAAEDPRVVFAAAPGGPGDKGDKGDKGDPGDPATNLITSVAGRQGDIVLAQADITGLTTALSAKETSANKGQPDGYAPLDATSLIPPVYLPAYVDDVLEFANYAALPVIGEASKIYVTIDTNQQWRWGGSVYVEIGPSPGSTDSVVEGSANKYYTDARVDARIESAGKATVLSGAAAPSDSLGVVGNYYVNTVGGVLYGPKNDASSLYGTPESILATTPASTGATAYKIGNTYLTHIAGLIVSARFYRAAATAETSHTIDLYDAAHTLLATTVATAEAAYTAGWVTADFPTPVPVATGVQFTVAVSVSAYSYSTNLAVEHPANATYVRSNYGTYGGGFPSLGSDTTYNYYTDVVWRPADAPVWPPTLTGKADTVHAHAQADITGLTTALANKVDGSANGTPTALTLWTGTAAQYAAIGTKSSSTVYAVTA